MATPLPVSTPLPRPRRARRHVSVNALYLGLAAGGAAVAALATIRPPLAVAAVVALAFVPLVLARPIVGLSALLFLSFLETYSAMTGVASATKLLGGVLVLAWLATVTTRESTKDGIDGLAGRLPHLAVALVLFTAWAALSLVWAEDPGEARHALTRFALNFVLFPIALLAVRNRRHVIWLVVIFVVGSLAATALGLSQGTIADAETEGRLKGAGLNPNQLGSYLVVAAIFAAVFVAYRRWTPAARLGVLALAGLAAIAAFSTLSRGALVGLAAALAVAPLAVGRGRRLGAVVLVAVTLVGAVGWFTAVAPAGALERITSAQESGGSGRTDLWRVGWRMVEANPVHGVGAGNFRVSAVHYVLRPGPTERDEIIIDDRRVAHNIYLTVLSELGAVGLALFLFIVAVCGWCALRAAAVSARRGDLMLELVARGLFLGLLSMLVADFFSSALYSKQLWMLLALAPALLVVAERAEHAGVRVTRLPRLRPLRAPAAG